MVLLERETRECTKFSGPQPHGLYQKSSRKNSESVLLPHERTQTGTPSLNPKAYFHGTVSVVLMILKFLDRETWGNKIVLLMNY